MTFYKIKRIAMARNGRIMFYLTNGQTVVQHNGRYVNDYNADMTPMFDSETNELVGFIEPNEIYVEIEPE